MVNPSKKAGLGRTLNRAQRVANQRRNPRKSARHTVDTEPNQDNARLNLKSVINQTNLDEFLEEAELAGKQFVTERRNIALIDNETKSKIDLYSNQERMPKTDQIKIEDLLNEDDDTLSVPRRPAWNSETTPEQLDELERKTFLAWRRKLARLQENDRVTLTPFEKNLEVWRQLWRVIERSDVVVQILDCRNPLLYLCDDLIKYVEQEFDNKKMSLILLNKADYLTQEQRLAWLKYFKVRNIKVIFFSALYENENMHITRRTSETENADDDATATLSDEEKAIEEEDDSEEVILDRLKNNLNLSDATPKPESEIQDDADDRIYNKFELIDAWRELLQKMEHIQNRCKDFTESDNNSETAQTRPLTVGLVGYPNVGKSSTINALLSAKRVAVSATPGKTKHFQTFLIDRDMMLCDCPGLVFPNFVSCKSEMVINGILPIDQMKDCVGPVRLIVDRIPRSFLEEIYGLAFDQDAKQNIIADDLLNAFGYMRGYMTPRGLPDISRASRVICKDYINGKILYCEPPPGADKKLYHSNSKLADAMKRIEELRSDPRHALKITERQRKLMKQAQGTDISSKDFDAQYFRERSHGFHVRGLPGIGNMTSPLGTVNDVKQAKREKKHKKKEKLRRVYRYLDD